ncbi:(Fe-S)-binding protein [Granulicella paludicola]|uniref:(Fe-S)-binding protein n=1 Tax=Granulicella paludicola TaxID=474951 RepID=UPI0021DFE06B|nr:heterodisulfide reductase-related iron-sulfur binding cluster [Granulicella paludicola]
MPEPLTQIQPAVTLPLSLLDKCVHCGFCLPACPTYVLWGNEMDSPRGRIWMMRKSTIGEANEDEHLDHNLRTHIDNCLGCMSCMTACPSGVEYNKLIEDTRAQIEAHTVRPLSERLFRWMLFSTFPHPTRLKLLGLPIALYQRFGIQALARKSGLLNLLPRRLHAMEALLPTVPLNPFRKLPKLIPAQTRWSESPQDRVPHVPLLGSGFAESVPVTNTLGRVAMLTGCVQDAYFKHVNEATARVLSAVGYDVVIPPAQGCCGALMVHSGLEHEAMDYARRMIAIFERAQADTIVINAAGCGSTMKEYAHLLRNDPAWSGRAARFSKRCKDISELLAAAPITAQLSPLPLRAAYHDACHLRHAQGIYAEPRALLAHIPGLTIAELAESNICCGSAGVYNLLHPETADELGDRKVQHLLETKAEALISANPGCLLQLQAALRRNGHAELPTFHMVELLDASLRSLTVDNLLKRH